jgi:hypothetical protein
MGASRHKGEDRRKTTNMDPHDPQKWIDVGNGWSFRLPTTPEPELVKVLAHPDFLAQIKERYPD